MSDIDQTTESGATTYWASRVARGHDGFFWKELQAGRLRQGWGYEDNQDLRVVLPMAAKDRDGDQRLVMRHRHMLDGWQVGDVVLVPNMPHRGMFALVKVTGEYDYAIDRERDDFGHIRGVELLTPHGIANHAKIVNSDLKTTLRNAGRTWRVRGRDDSFERILAHRLDEDVIRQSTATERVASVMETVMANALAAMRATFDDGANQALGKAEWEGVIADALQVHFPTSQIEKTGGRSKKGADIVVTTPNPFGGPAGITVIQVKDWNGMAGAKPMAQLQKAIETRREYDEDGGITRHVISAVLTLGKAEPKSDLIEAARELEKSTGVPVTLIYGDELMELILSGTVRRLMDV